MTIAAVLEGKGPDVETIIASATLAEAVATLGARRIGALPVVDGDSVAGMFSERDVIYALREHGSAALDWPVERIMSSPAITVEREFKILEALALMTKRRIRHLTVVEGGRLVGIVSIGDLVKHRMEQVEAEAEAMRCYIQSA